MDDWLYCLRVDSVTAERGVDVDESVFTKHRELNAHRFKIIQASLIIEHHLATFVAKYLFNERTEQSDFFQSHIIRSDLISFSGRKRLVLEIIEKENLLSGSEKNDFNKLLAKILRYRNAFTHGNFVERPSGVLLEYYEGGKRTKELGEPYFIEINGDFFSYYKIWDEVFKFVQ